MMTLHGPTATHQLIPDFALVAALEAEHGSLYEMASDLFDKTLPLSEMIEVVGKLFRHAGARVTPDFLLGQPCAEILIQFLLAVLEPVEKSAAAAADNRALEDMLKNIKET